MKFEVDEDLDVVRFKDADDDEFVIDAVGGLLYFNRDGSPLFAVHPDGCRMLSRVLAYHAAHRTLEGVRTAIDGVALSDESDGKLAAQADRIDDAEEKLESLSRIVDGLAETMREVRQTLSWGDDCAIRDLRSRTDRLEAFDVATRDQAKAHAMQLAEVRDRLDEIEDRLATPGPVTAAEPEKTPQELADEMTARFPVGTDVKFRFDGHATIWPGRVASGFAVGPEDRPVAYVASKTVAGTRYLVSDIWLPK